MSEWAIVASGNQGKLNGISTAVAAELPDLSFEFSQRPVQIKGENQPWGKEGTAKVAKARIRAILPTLDNSDNTWVIAQESGLRRVTRARTPPVDIINTTVIYHRGHWSVGWARTVRLTDTVRDLVWEGKELADAFRLAFEHDTDRQGNGGVFEMTRNTPHEVTRLELIKESTIDALRKMKALKLP